MSPLYEPVPGGPMLDGPVLVLGMEGWIDAGAGGQAALAALLADVETTVVGRFDADALLDRRARRPVLRLVDGVIEGFNWPDIELRAGQDRAGHDLLVLSGPEPDFKWQRFASEVVELAVGYGVRMVCGLGAFPAPVPHTRDVRLGSTATSAALAVQVGFVAGTMDVPAGMHAVLEGAFGQAGVPAVGLWARVPHYAAAMPYPAASVALLDALRTVSGIEVDTEELQGAARLARQRIDELISNSDEHEQLVRQLEQALDSEERSPFGPGDLPSGDEIAAELERFLRGER
ncbi:MAG TPA: PAC2 family protein [Acidimicrobiales bacterium]|nr:PAC2 family protein [Acidimicrobiales bacterium]